MGHSKRRFSTQLYRRRTERKTHIYLFLLVFVWSCSFEKLRKAGRMEGRQPKRRILWEPVPDTFWTEPARDTRGPLHDFTTVADLEGLQRLVEVTESAAWMAVDTESNSQFAY